MTQLTSTSQSTNITSIAQSILPNIINIIGIMIGITAEGSNSTNLEGFRYCQKIVA